MGRKVVNITLRDQVPCKEIRKRTGVADIIEFSLAQNENGQGISKEQKTTNGKNESQIKSK